MPSAMPPPTGQRPGDLDVDDDEGWEEMPIVRNEDPNLALDEEDQKRYHYVAPKTTVGGMGNATGNLIDYDIHGNEWRAKLDVNENEYTRLRLEEEDTNDEVHLRTRYLFDEDKAMTPLSQMQATKRLLTEAQRIAYVGLCYLTIREMSKALLGHKELKPALQHLDLWGLKIMGRLYYHMELETQEQKMIESLAAHDLQPSDLVPSLMTTHTVANPEYDPAEAKRRELDRLAAVEAEPESVEVESEEDDHPASEEDAQELEMPETAKPTVPKTPGTVLQPHAPIAMPGVSTTLSAADREVTLDIRWTILCDLFLLVVADSVYDARSRVLLERVATHLGLGWLDVVKFEKRVTDALEIQESVERLEQQDLIAGHAKAAKKKRIVMMGLATIGGGLVIGLSAGLLAPVIGAGLGAALATVGITGTTSFLAGAGGAAVITTGGVLTGSSIAGRGMARRTRVVGIFELLPLHNHKRVNCIITVPGFMNGLQDDVRLPFSVLDPVVGDVFSILWEPEMMNETGNALAILTTEVLTQLGQTVLQATVMTALMSALQWPLILTKLGYLIDNPWSNALDRAKAAGGVLADVLLRRSLGVRPIALIGFSLGARVIFYALIELYKKKAFGIVQDVFLLGATVTASNKVWHQARGVVNGRFVNGYARNDWILNYLFRAGSGGFNTVAGLRPVENVPGLENVDVTDKIAGHMSYRIYMPVILDELGFPVTADYFDEPEQMKMEADRVVEKPEEEPKPKSFSLFGRRKPSDETGQSKAKPRPPSSFGFPEKRATDKAQAADDDLPEREEHPVHASQTSQSEPAKDDAKDSDAPNIPLHAGFDFKAIQSLISETKDLAEAQETPTTATFPGRAVVSPIARTESAPPHELPVPVQPSPQSYSDSEGESSVEDTSHKRSYSLDSVRDPSTARENAFTWNNTIKASRETEGAVERTHQPQLSFGSINAPVWASDSTEWKPEGLSPKESPSPIANDEIVHGGPWDVRPPAPRKDTLSLNPWGDN